MKRRVLANLIAWAFFLSVVFLLPGSIALAGNVHPCPFLEISMFDEPSPPPEYAQAVCYHQWIYRPPYYEGPMEPACFAAKPPYMYATLAVHIGCLDDPICPTVGPGCEQYGGFTGFAFGISTTGFPVSYLSFTPCPGFTENPSQAGAPAAISVSSTSGCRISSNHVGYLTYLNGTSAVGATYFDIVPNADLGYFKVVNCAGTYDEGTTIGGRAQWGGTKTLTCLTGGRTDVRPTTWGGIKALYR